MLPCSWPASTQGTRSHSQLSNTGLPDPRYANRPSETLKLPWNLVKSKRFLMVTWQCSCYSQGTGCLNVELKQQREADRQRHTTRTPEVQQEAVAQVNLSPPLCRTTISLSTLGKGDWAFYCLAQKGIKQVQIPHGSEACVSGQQSKVETCP